MARLFTAASSEYLITGGAPVTALPVTLACWFKPVATTVNYALMTLTDTAAGAIRLQLDAVGAVAGDPVRAVSVASGGGTSVASTSTGFSAGTWHHACGVWASATSRAAYIDGGSKGTQTTSRALGTPTAVTVGMRYDGAGPTAGFFMDGEIAEAAVWNVALSDADVASLAGGVSPILIRPDALVFYAPLIGRASPETDWRGGNSLTLTGTAASAHPRVFYAAGYRGQAVAPVTAFDPGSDAAWHGRAPVYVPRTTRILASGTTRVSREG